PVAMTEFVVTRSIPTALAMFGPPRSRANGPVGIVDGAFGDREIAGHTLTVARSRLAYIPGSRGRDRPPNYASAWCRSRPRRACSPAFRDGPYLHGSARSCSIATRASSTRDDTLSFRKT